MAARQELKKPLLPHLSHKEPPDYLGNASWLGYLFFWCGFPLMKLGNSRALVPQDLPHCPAYCRSEMLVTDFLTIWESLKKSGKQSIVLALWKLFWKDILISGLTALCKGAGILSGPIFLYYFVDYASGNVRFKHEGVVLLAALAVTKLVELFAQRHWYFRVRILGAKLSSVMMASVYQKELALSSVGRQRYTSGEIVNLVAVDAYRLAELAFRLHWAWLVPMVLVGAFTIASVVVGLAALPALVIIIVVIVGFSPLIKAMQVAQRKFMEKQDERLRATTEVLQGMKVIKLQAWEEKFNLFLEEMRKEELNYLHETQQKKMYATIVYWLMPTFLTCLVFITCLLIGIPLKSTMVFTVLAIFRIIQDPVRMTPDVLSSFIQAHISFIRLENFLQEEELPEGEALATVGGSETITSDYVIRVDGASLRWHPEDPQPTLRALDVVIKRGEKVAVCGSVGAGKTSLLLALLGEMARSSGTVRICGRLAYVSQGAWIQSMSVRDNILFGELMEGPRYKRVVRACALEEDMKCFSHGDLTEIGERGTNLSGGQKQRIQLARAVYNDADIYLLDDPFSAVDAHTSSHLFHECVMGALKDKTVVLVTHQMEYLPFVDTILVMQDGEIRQAGSYNDLLAAGDVFEKLVSAHETALHTVVDDKQRTRVDVQKAEGSEAQFQKIQKRLSREESLSDLKQAGASPDQLVKDEEIAPGKVGLGPYVSYFQVSGARLVPIVLVLSQILFSGFQLFGNVWLAQGLSNEALSSQVLIGVYCALSVACMLAFALRSQMIVLFGLQASRSFFTKLMNSLMKAPMGFFDATPSGRILNRASVDMSVIDLDIPFAISFVLGMGFDFLCIVIVVCLVTWQMIFVIIPALVVTMIAQRYNETALQQLNRINSTTKAPIVNKSAETWIGSATIRAFRQSERFKRENLRLIDRDTCAYIYKFVLVEWKVLHIEFCSTIMLVMSACLVILDENISGGFTGLAVTYALAFGSSLVVCIIQQSLLAIFVVSVERIRQYLDLPREAPAVIESNRPPSNWPQRGEVVLDNLQIRYRERTPLVLKGISCTFHGGHKIGVVGRTGSGKTTLISALFRLVEPANGTIFIDGIDICSIGLHDLRFKLGIIPQEPVLFHGTVRTNLDPLNQYTDFEVWEALRKSKLDEVIQKLPLQLETPVSDQGENWSAGQRQLFCLGRVLLKRSQVLVLDEATASIDSATDAFLQRVIRDEFSACTVITVAHRIPTVIDSDMVLALRDGVAVEYDSPKKLIEQKNSLFALLVAEYWAQAGRTS
ncbi:hypothetical protein GOP47_0007922 [Adiantum capillus-veneris]|uniref:Uncharacterized protein n=1 Tax=Adiantum capillus-veneris TaxID=13818 RepID=A0A9D4V1Z6_ADICA|nr:hypothetical protein GOP47_0007356 [Adiantum capillus-veneris]KAI5078098.1 hypothetical protein GOP47_0007922 [Adiantum capillus-veneris]